MTLTAAGPRLVADAIANIVTWRCPIIEATRLMIARATRLAALVASGATILPAAGLALARRPVFIGYRIAEAIRLDARIGAVRITWATRISARSAVALSLAARARARRTKTTRSRATRTTARGAAWRSASLVAAWWAAAGLSGKPGRLVNTNLLLRRGAA